jgi:hypothetical protein
MKAISLVYQYARWGCALRKQQSGGIGEDTHYNINPISHTARILVRPIRSDSRPHCPVVSAARTPPVTAITGHQHVHSHVQQGKKA